MPDRDAAPAVVEGAPDAAFEAWLAERVNFAATSLLGLTLRPTFDAGWDAAVAARPAPAAAPRASDEDIREQTLREIEAIADSVEAASRRARDPHHELTLHERALAIRAAAADVRAAAIEAARGEGGTNG